MKWLNILLLQDRCLLNIEATIIINWILKLSLSDDERSSYCYKFIIDTWYIFQKEKNETTFDEIINEMIANACIQYGISYSS